MGVAHKNLDSFQDLFLNGMKRHLGSSLPEPPPGVHLNLGAGNSPISGAVNLDRPEWEAPFLVPEWESDSVAAVHAYHFLEHLSGPNVAMMLREVDRVLKSDGLFYYCVPYAMSPIAFMDVDHKTFWTEETMRTLTDPRGYSSAYAPNGKLRIIFQVIAGLTSQNLAVLGVLKKEHDTNGN